MQPGETQKIDSRQLPSEEEVGDAARVIADCGIVVVPHFMPAPIISGLRAEAGRLRALGEFRRAGIGAAGDFRTRDDIRGDEIHWIDSTSGSAPIVAALAAFERLRQCINRELFLGLFDFECHLARYCAGAGYQRHYDQLRGDECRQLTVTLYLNERWEAADGGVLRVYLDNADPQRTLDIVPAGGTMVAFLSERFAHEVLPCRRERLSLTGWFRRR